jgi:hypothetical protein
MIANCGAGSKVSRIYIKFKAIFTRPSFFKATCIFLITTVIAVAAGSCARRF